ncbi:MAG: hypothetical protein J6C28_02505 [Bacilli bacterium]|nr:hypothetical protein [Bacilli bacterium]
MKKINKRVIFVFLLIILLILKLIFVDRDVLSIVLSSSFLGFYLITFINYFRKKETCIEKNYLKIILLLLVLAYGIQTCILLFTGKDIVLSLYYFICLWMIFDSTCKLLKKDYEAKKIFVAAIIMYVLPYLRLINLELFVNFLCYVLIAVYFNSSKENYFGIFDQSLISKNKGKFKWTQWIKTCVLIMNGIIYLLCPIAGGGIAVLNWLLCFRRFFDNLVSVYEQKLFSKKLRKNKEFIACRNIYLLAPSEDDYLKNRLEVVAKETFLEEGIPNEVYALMEVSSARKFESIKELNYENNDDLLKQVNMLFKNNTRPEVICIMLCKVFGGKKKIISKLEKVTKEFNSMFIELVNEKKSVLDKSEQVNQLYKKYCDDIVNIID